MPSFDISCEFDRHETMNAIDQANREVTARFDFKGIDAKFELQENAIKLSAEADFQLTQMYDILCNKLSKRNVDIGHLEPQEAVLQLKSAVQDIKLKSGIPGDTAKKITKFIKGKKLKVQAAIQGEEIRVTGKKRDDLQETMAAIREEDFGLPIQFGNFRD